ncbi:unnamed protein product [Mycena citricolor]|uniref:Uncharacterized protein n=1 Tax=Mycena citricolor TaxID=2018698 RepID=A0AAD2HXC2_9AGAR|nr:unnamed protein product [Mycena citricolor]
MEFAHPGQTSNRRMDLRQRPCLGCAAHHRGPCSSPTGVPSIFTCFRAGSNCKRALRCGGLGEMDSVAHRMSPPARGMRSACSSSVGAPEKTEAIVGTTRSPAVVAREKAEGGDCWGMTSCASASFLRFSSLRGALGRGWDINGALKVDDVNFLHRGFA